LDRSLTFYSGLLGPLGWRWVREVEGERGETIHYLFRRDGRASVGLRSRQSEGPLPYDRYGVGVHHIAFEGGSRGAVDRVARWAGERDVEIESGPQEYQYSPGYYAVFLHDPDGIKVEVMHRPRLRTLFWAMNPTTTPFRPRNRQTE
jgi:catechol 2,3-dioxygenase-like lactoylglutathione lyase family enzyme